MCPERKVNVVLQFKMDVVEVPTNLPVIRVDYEDAVYKTQEEKFNAVVSDIEEAHKKGQPVLVGTINIDTSEYLSDKLKKKGIKHKVLNAKFHELEAEIIADAGQKGAVTIATNMAGRGTEECNSCKCFAFPFNLYMLFCFYSLVQPVREPSSWHYTSAYKPSSST